MKRKTIERDIHRAVVDHLNRRAKKGVVWWHNFNNPRGKINGAILQRMGLRKGVADLSVVSDGKYCALELKAPGKKPTPEQKQFLSEIIAAGGFAEYADSLDGALNHLNHWGVFR